MEIKSLICAIALCGSIVSDANAQQKEFRPGQVWNDVSGKAINAHAGCIVKSDGYYYWIGDRRSKNDCLGVGCYRSSDLYNWTDLGYAVRLQGSPQEDGQDFAAGRALYRPKIAYNAKTGKWVLNVVWENDNQGAIGRVAFATADAPQGPYTLEKVGMTYTSRTRDQGIFQDDDGALYYQACINGNTDMWNCLMSEDYLSTTETSAVILPGSRYEAPALFRVGDTYFGLFSGCTYWDANRSRYAYGYDLLSTWNYEKIFTDKTGSGIPFCVDDSLSNTYQSQSAYVFKVDGDSKKLIYVGDRWNSSNLESSRIVWLPISMRSGRPAVRWYDRWDLSIFDDMYRFKRSETIEDGDEILLLERNSNRFLSRPKATFILDNDSETSNVRFRIFRTDKPYTYRLQEVVSGKYLESVFGSLRLSAGNAKETQSWIFILQSDGTYKIRNASDSNCLTVSAASTFAGTSVYLDEMKDSYVQAFSVCFDSEKFPEKQEAQLFTKEYRAEVEERMREQSETLTGITDVVMTNETDGGFRCTRQNGALSIYSSVVDGDALVRVYSPIGRLIDEQNVSLGVGCWNSVGTVLPEGFYLISICCAEKEIVLKIR